MAKSTLKIITNQVMPCQMNLMTQEVIKFISSRVSISSTFVDLTWFNQFDVSSITKFDTDVVFAVDVADPIYFQNEKVDWINKVNKPVIFVGSPNSIFDIPCVPFLGWLRYRTQQFTDKNSYDKFFINFNRTPRDHRKIFYDNLKSHSLYSKGHTSFSDDKQLHQIGNPNLNNNIVELQTLAQIIDDKQLSSMFEFVTETDTKDNQIFLSEKTAKCISCETPMFLLGNPNSLSMLKSYYGFTDFSPDDSYDSINDYDLRNKKVLDIASHFFDYPMNSVFDNAKKNAYHLYNNFDQLHDKIAEKYLEKSLSYV